MTRTAGARLTFTDARCAECGAGIVAEPGADGRPEWVHRLPALDRAERHDARFCRADETGPVARLYVGT